VPVPLPRLVTHTGCMSTQSPSAGRSPSAERARQVLVPVVAMVALMWLLELLDVLARGRMDYWGIQSRSVAGLVGVPLAPFLHAGFAHLMANTVPFIVLGLLVAWRTGPRMWPVTVTIGILGGLGVWLLGPANSVTIGASGMVFGFFAYLVTAAILTRHWLDIVLAVLVLLFYGGLVWGILPTGVAPGVSWLAHLTGAAAGVAAAFAFARRTAEPAT
jgi:membrane associated rhomboid family serine protease